MTVLAPTIDMVRALLAGPIWKEPRCASRACQREFGFSVPGVIHLVAAVWAHLIIWVLLVSACLAPMESTTSARKPEARLA